MQSKPTPSVASSFSAFAVASSLSAPSTSSSSYFVCASENKDTYLLPDVPDLQDSDDEETESDEDDPENEDRKAYVPRGAPVNTWPIIDGEDMKNHEFPLFAEISNGPMGHTHNAVDEMFQALHIRHQMQLQNTFLHAHSAAVGLFEPDVPDLEDSYNPFRDAFISKL